MRRQTLWMRNSSRKRAMSMSCRAWSTLCMRQITSDRILTRPMKVRLQAKRRNEKKEPRNERLQTHSLLNMIDANDNEECHLLNN